MSGTELKDLFGRVVEPIDEMPNLVPRVVAAGQRSVRRRRIGGSVLAAAAGAAVVVSVVLVDRLPGGGSPVGPAGQPIQDGQPGPTSKTGQDASPRRSLADGTGTADCHTTEEGNTMANGKPVSDALRQFHVRSAPVLEAVLPEQVDTVEAMPQMQSFCLTTNGRRYALTLRVDAVPVAEEGRCTADARMPCSEGRLPNGHWAVAWDSHARTILAGHVVTIDVFGPAPITAEDLLDAMADPRFTAMVDEWASHPAWTAWGGDGRATKPTNR
jgi:hypothetical protein